MKGDARSVDYSSCKEVPMSDLPFRVKGAEVMISRWGFGIRLLAQMPAGIRAEILPAILSRVGCVNGFQGC